MSRNMSLAVSVGSAVALFVSTGSASAQYYDPCCNPCVQCVQPVVQNCYQTVPVTEYQEVKQTVQRPVMETQYVEQPVTEYVPITEQRTAMVPQVEYDNITECQTVCRDMGQWVTRREAIHRPSPCEYDPRPTFTGWFNRTTYGMRTAFSPKAQIRREYVPNVVAQTIPVTRRVARNTTRQVTYNVTRMEARQTTRRVAVNTVRYVAEEVTAMRPVTVMRTVPIGTSVAFAVSPFGVGTATALAPIADPVTSARKSPTPITAGEDKDKFNRSAEKAEPFKQDQTGASLEHSTNRFALPEGFTPVRQREAAEPAAIAAAPKKFTSRVPSVVRVNQFAGRARAEAGIAAESGPQLIAPSVAVAQNAR